VVRPRFSLANFVPLEAIATMGSAGFLLLFMAVNIANLRLARNTGVTHGSPLWRL